MEQIAFRMTLLPGRAEEYRRRHDAIWPDLVSALKVAGIFDYSIWLDTETNALFAVLRRPADHSMDRLPLDPVMRRWWDHMRDIMETEPDGTPHSVPLSPMFHLA